MLLFFSEIYRKKDVTATAWTGNYGVSFPSVHQGFLTYRIDSDRLFL